MKKFITIASSAFIALTLVATGPASAAELKVGVVNEARILDASPQAEDAQKRLSKEFSGRKTKLQNRESELKRKEERMAKDGDTLSEQERRSLEKDIMSLHRELKREQDEFREDVSIRRSEELRKVQVQVVEAIQSVAKEEGLDLVMGHGLLNANPRLDVTDKVVDRLKRSGKPAAP